MKTREFSRFNSIHLVSYTLYNEDGKNCGEGVARTLNISKGGALLEINQLIEEPTSEVILEMALDDTIVDINGRVAFSRTTEKRMTEIGIQFSDLTEESRNFLEGFLKTFTSGIDKNRKLLRESVSNINNVVLTLSKEHKIINDYVIECRKMLGGEDRKDETRNLELLFDLMQKDLNTHFRFEEETLFVAALSGEQDDAMVSLIKRLNEEHEEIHERIDMLLDSIKSHTNQNTYLDHTLIQRIDSLIDLIKDHAKNEMVNLFPAIDSDRNKINILNKLINLTKKNN